MPTMYDAVLLLHSWIRWAVLLLALLVLSRAISGRSQHRPWTPADDTVMKWLVIVVDIQFLLGLALYVALSPTTKAAFADPGSIMRTSALRFWTVEHLTGMLAAVALVHVGRVMVRRTTDGDEKHGKALTFIAIALFLMLLSIPWPGMPNGRELFRL